MALFDGFRRKRDQPEEQEDNREPDENDGEGDHPGETVDLYRSISLNALPAGEDVLLHDPERAAPIVLPSFELDLLAHCTPFAAIESHAAKAAHRMGLPADGVAQRLYELADMGLLVSRQSVIDRARSIAASDASVPPVLDRVAVITSDRPASLDACLRSYRERYGSDLELVVFDDSGDAAVRQENRNIAAKAGGRILYAGETEKNRLVTELAARSGVDPAVVRAAVVDIDGKTYHCGANRNAVLLHAAGGAILMVDDDTTARAARPADAGDGIRLSSIYDPWSLRFFPRPGDALDAAEWADVDLIAWHQHFLGRSIPECAFSPDGSGSSFELDAHAEMLDLDHADGALIDAFSRGRGNVAATSSGIAGDSGMGFPLYFLSLRGLARDRMLENYELNRATRAVHRGVDVATISSSQIFMGAHFAVDTRGLVPPFPPVLRSSDGVFGALLRKCAPESYIAFLPCLVEHTPPDIRPSDFDRVVRSVASVRANDIIRDLTHSFEPAPGVVDPSIRLRAYGQYLIALSAMPPADFDAFIRQQIAAAVGRRIERLAQALNDHESQPEQWARDCEIVAAEGIRALTEDPLLVADIPGDSPEERSRRFQRVLDRFGRVLDAWPTLMKAATDLRVAEPVNA